MVKNNLKSESGVSLIEVMIAGVVAIGIAIGIAKMGQNASKSATKVKLDSEIADFKNYIKTNFSRGHHCTKTFEDTDYDMRNPNGSTSTDSVVPPGLETGATPAYYDVPNLLMVTAVNLDPLDADYKKSIAWVDLVVDAPLKGHPNWILRELRLYQMANPSGGATGDDNTGVCSIYYKAERQKGINSKRSFGSSEIIFWTTVSCALHGAAATEGNPDRMAYCQENQAVVPGYWVLKEPTIPDSGITYGFDVYVEKDVNVTGHVIVESDERIKRNTVIIDRATEKLSEINGFYYFLRHEDFPHKSYSKDRQIGFLAQQLEKIFPEAVKTNKKTGFKSVRYSMLVPVLVEAHKEQEKKIKYQAREIKALNRKVDLLIKKINLK